MGGVGIVYAAYDPRLGRDVAIKTLRAQGSNADPNLLLREARAMAQLSHPNVMTVYDAGREEDRVFIAMELVSAPNLRVFLAAAPPADVVLRILLQAGAGLAAAHAEGLMHRDFKPDNVLVPEGAPVRVTDFGLARFIPEHISSVEPRTAAVRQLGDGSSARSGTPPYMSPEQLRGQEQGPLSDQWAYCVTCYEALAGFRPFTGHDLERLSTGASIAPPPLPSSVPPRISRALRRGLSIDPAERFLNMGDLLRQLKPRGSWLSPPRLAALGGVGLLVATLVVGRGTDPCTPDANRVAGVWDEPTQHGAMRSVAERDPQAWPRLHARLDLQLETWLQTWTSICLAAQDGGIEPRTLDARMACLDTNWRAFEATTAALEHPADSTLAEAMSAVQDLPPPQRCLAPLESWQAVLTSEQQHARAEIESSMRRSRTLRRSGKPGKASRSSDEAVSRARAIAVPALLVDALLERGRARLALGDRGAAAEDAREATLLAEAERLHAQMAEASLDLADIARSLGQTPQEALQHTRRAEAALARTTPSPQLASRYSSTLARLLDAGGEPVRAYDHAREAVRVLERANQPDALALALALRTLGKVEISLREVATAERTLQRSRALLQDALGPGHPQEAQVLAYLGACSILAGDPERAIERLEAASAKFEANPSHPERMPTLANLGAALRDTGRLDESAARYHAALESIDTSVDPSGGKAAALWLNLAGVELERGRNAEAAAAAERAYDGLVAALGPSHPSTLTAQANLGRIQLLGGELEAATDNLREALRQREQVLGSEHLETVRTRHAWAMVRHASGDARAAIALLERVSAAYEVANAPRTDREAVRNDLATVRGDSN